MSDIIMMEKYDKTIFIQNIIFDNMLAYDLHQKRIRTSCVETDVARAVFTLRCKSAATAVYMKLSAICSRIKKEISLPLLTAIT